MRKKYIYFNLLLLFLGSFFFPHNKAFASPADCTNAGYRCVNIFSPGCARERIFSSISCDNWETVCCAPAPICPTLSTNGQFYSCVEKKNCPRENYYSGVACAKTSEVCCSPIPIPAGNGTCMSDKGIPTAIGCIEVFDAAHNKSDVNIFVGGMLRLGVGISGGIAFLLMLFGTIRIMLSAGDPKGIQAGKELITSAIIGLLFVIFSVFLLRLIGFDILGLPGFSR